MKEKVRIMERKLVLSHSIAGPRAEVPRDGLHRPHLGRWAPRQDHPSGLQAELLFPDTAQLPKIAKNTAHKIPLISTQTESEHISAALSVQGAPNPTRACGHQLRPPEPPAVLSSH